MAKHKTLQSVVTSVAESFTSSVNWGDDDYVMGHLLAAARETGRTRLEVDLLSGQMEPKELLRKSIVRSISYRCADFPRLVERSGSDPGFVTSAHMSIEFDITVEQPVQHARHLKQSPFVCTVVVTDDHGKRFEAVRRGWWCPEPMGKVRFRQRLARAGLAWLLKHHPSREK